VVGTSACLVRKSTNSPRTLTDSVGDDLITARHVLRQAGVSVIVAKQREFRRFYLWLDAVALGAEVASARHLGADLFEQLVKAVRGLAHGGERLRARAVEDDSDLHAGLMQFLGTGKCAVDPGSSSSFF
jgi:hypothetical protein